jgi:ComF family protein
MTCQPTPIQLVYRWLKNTQDCLLCGQGTGERLPLCTACKADLPYLAASCQRCALPVAEHNSLCAECLLQPPAFDRVYAAFRYAFPVDRMIVAFKHQARWPLGLLLSRLSIEQLSAAQLLELQSVDRVLAVPISKQRLRLRGFNQAEFLAVWLGKQLKRPVDKRLLRRTQQGPAQQQLNAKARKHNLQHAFTVNPRQAQSVQGQHLLIVDDVLTTGATANALAVLLKRQGARQVDIYCLARTGKPDH